MILQDSLVAVATLDTLVLQDSLAVKVILVILDLKVQFQVLQDQLVTLDLKEFKD